MVIQPKFEIPQYLIKILGIDKILGSDGVICEQEVAEEQAGVDKLGFVGNAKNFASHLPVKVSDLPALAKKALKIKAIPALVAGAVTGKALVAAGIGVAVAGVACGSIYLAKKIKSKRQAQAQKIIGDYNISLVMYLDAIDNQRLDREIVKSLIEDLGKLEEIVKSEKVEINFSGRALNALKKCLLDYTEQLVKANEGARQEVRAFTATTSKDPFINLNHYLEIQRKIFETTD
ncbi:MAG: hypothetical protein FWE21_04335 [Defluviitaleaceae bacterium]|nr:hypothetical protein [Defluviitaleaceae bacterium]